MNKKAKDVIPIENQCQRISKTLPEYMQWSFAVLRRLGFPVAQINETLKAFKGIPNRGELVLRMDSLMFINDSSSCIPESVGFAVENLNNMHVHLICGGYGKNLKANGMEKALKSVASIHLLKGSFTDKCLIPFLKANNIPYFGPFDTIDDAVKSANTKAHENTNYSHTLMQVVLLSPGTPAQYPYKNEFFRGDSFRNSVLKIVEPF